MLSYIFDDGAERTRGKAIGLYAAFRTSVTTPNEKGAVPIVSAVRLDRLINTKPLILRVSVASAKGGIVTSKNLWTTFGADPVRVSGGVAISYLVTDPTTGATVDGNSLSCTTALTSLRRVQDGTWDQPRGGFRMQACRLLLR